MDLPAGVTVFERGWLSANNILVASGGCTALVDTGYCTHGEQTVALVSGTLGERRLDLLLNTHLHSDHCGGNAALQARYPAVQTFIPPGLAAHVQRWDPVALTYVPTGQECPPFTMQGVIRPGSEIMLGEVAWQVHGAPGHDPNSIILFDPQSRTLISADALWENGFGVVFQELEGDHAFDEVAATLDVIERLAPAIVIPGHGAVFTQITDALALARRRLERFVRDPKKHATHAAKVLLKFKLLELQRLDVTDFTSWARATPYFGLIHNRWFSAIPQEEWIQQLAADLVRTGAAAWEGDQIVNVSR